MSKIKLKVRLDYLSKGKASKLFFGGKSSEEMVEEIRQHKVSVLRNVPFQGVFINEIDMSMEIYKVYDEIYNKTLAYAPVMITFTADSLEDALRFVIKEEFRTIEVLEPDEINLNKLQVEKLFFKMGEEIKYFKDYIERKIDNWK